MTSVELKKKKQKASKLKNLHPRFLNCFVPVSFFIFGNFKDSSTLCLIKIQQKIEWRHENPRPKHHFMNLFSKIVTFIFKFVHEAITISNYCQTYYGNSPRSRISYGIFTNPNKNILTVLFAVQKVSQIYRRLQIRCAFSDDLGRSQHVDKSSRT